VGDLDRRRRARLARAHHDRFVELFGAMSGSAVGTVAAVGRLLLPALRENGYDERFAVS